MHVETNHQCLRIFLRLGPQALRRRDIRRQFLDPRHNASLFREGREGDFDSKKLLRLDAVLPACAA